MYRQKPGNAVARIDDHVSDQDLEVTMAFQLRTADAPAMSVAYSNEGKVRAGRTCVLRHPGSIR